MDVTLPRQGQAVMDYSERLFERSTFQASLNSLERDMHTLLLWWCQVLLSCLLVHTSSVRCGSGHMTMASRHSYS